MKEKIEQLIKNYETEYQLNKIAMKQFDNNISIKLRYSSKERIYVSIIADLKQLIK